MWWIALGTGVLAYQTGNPFAAGAALVFIMIAICGSLISMAATGFQWTLESEASQELRRKRQKKERQEREKP